MAVSLTKYLLLLFVSFFSLEKLLNSLDFLSIFPCLFSCYFFFIHTFIYLAYNIFNFLIIKSFPFLLRQIFVAKDFAFFFVDLINVFEELIKLIIYFL